MHVGNAPPKASSKEMVVAAGLQMRSEKSSAQSGASSGARAGTGDGGRTTSRGSSSDRSQSLNVIFNYNGHSWDAYETLGIPAGASRGMVEEAYKRAIAEVSPDSREFIDTAYKSIINR